MAAHGNISFCFMTEYYSFVTPWSVACQASLSMGFPKQEYWSWLPFLSPGDLPNSGIEPTSPALAGGFFTTEPPGKPYVRAHTHTHTQTYTHTTHVHMPHALKSVITWWTLGLFPCMATVLMHSAAMNIGVHVSF